MAQAPSTVLVTGAAGNLGQRLLPLLCDLKVIAVDMKAPTAPHSRFEQIDLGRESACEELIQLLRSTGAEAIVHLAFVLDPLRTGVLDKRKMWQINVAGTARVLEAVAEVNRHGGRVRQFIHLSSVSAYGPDLPAMVTEDHPLEAHTLTYAVHKAESDHVVQSRAEELGDCRAYILRPHIFTGASVENYMVGALRGTPSGNSRWAARMRSKGKRLPLLMPMGGKNLENRFQFVHVDDVARLISWLLRNGSRSAGLTILNVGGRGQPLRFQDCWRISGGKLVRLPGQTSCKFVLQLLWGLGISGIPPEAAPYMFGSYTMDTRRLQQLLGKEYDQVIRYTVADALADSFSRPANEAAGAKA